MPCGAMWCHMVPCSAVWCHVVPCGATWCQAAACRAATRQCSVPVSLTCLGAGAEHRQQQEDSSSSSRAEHGALWTLSHPAVSRGRCALCAHGGGGQNVHTHAMRVCSGCTRMCATYVHCACLHMGVCEREVCVCELVCRHGVRVCTHAHAQVPTCTRVHACSCCIGAHSAVTPSSCTTGRTGSQRGGGVDAESTGIKGREGGMELPGHMHGVRMAPGHAWRGQRHRDTHGGTMAPGSTW